ncbi:pinin/SDK/memA/ protein conserved region-domain-containing protein [Choanephora cucurbitarum]|nr:pinin/SDK/memA/ protein conserved region-domain-containing protein [Choanephora cucurbitarum]
MVQSSIIVPESTTNVPSNKRRAENADLETSATSEEVKRPRLIDQDETGKKRNKRLFGTLLGTLSKFKNETEKDSEINKNRQAINNKLQEKLEQERKELQEKLKARKEEKMRLAEQKIQEEQRLLEEKKELSKILQNEKLAYFLKTTTQPTLYYLPQKLTDEMAETIELQKKEALTARIQFEERGEKNEGKRKHDDRSEEEDDPIQDDSEQYDTNKKEEE